MRQALAAENRGVLIDLVLSLRDLPEAGEVLALLERTLAMPAKLMLWDAMFASLQTGES